MNNDTFHSRLIQELEHVNQSLSKLLKRLDGPRQNHEEADSPQNDATAEGDSRQGKALTLSHVDPSPIPKKDAEKGGYKSFQWWKSRIELVGVFFAIAYAVITYFLWCDQRQNFVVQQRSWVGVKDAGIDSGTVSITLSNTGATPAINVSVNCCIFRYKSLALSPPSFIQLYSSMTPAEREASGVNFDRHAVIPPGANPKLPVRYDNIVDTPKGMAFYAVGVITYSDIFNPTIHHTTICLLQTTSVGLSICADGQEMD